jgi:hypothetical protein
MLGGRHSSIDSKPIYQSKGQGLESQLHLQTFFWVLGIWKSHLMFEVDKCVSYRFDTLVIIYSDMLRSACILGHLRSDLTHFWQNHSDKYGLNAIWHSSENRLPVTWTPEAGCNLRIKALNQVQLFKANINSCEEMF